MTFMQKIISMLAACLLLLAACALGQVSVLDRSQPFVWTVQPFDLPSSIMVYKGEARAVDGSPIRAWYADVDYSDTRLKVRPFLSDDARGKERSSSMARKIGAYVAINGGYFDVQAQPARTFSLVQNAGVVASENIGRVNRPGRKYSVTRSAFGVRADRSFDFAWVHHFDGALYAFAEPNPNTVLTPAPDVTPQTPGASLWNIADALGGGPRLVQDGRVRVTYEEEVFFGSGFGRDNPYPRAAIGATANGHLIFFATDDLAAPLTQAPTVQPDQAPDVQLANIGLSLPQLAQTLIDLGCVQAMNLDGGGSQTFVINGVAVNKSAPNQERAVTSILGIVPAG